MKKIFFLSIILSLLSCGGSDNKSVEPFISTQPEELLFSYQQTTLDLYLSTNDKWIAEISPIEANSWLKLNQNNGLVGEFMLQISTDQNGNNKDRKATITIKNDITSKEIKINQKKWGSLIISKDFYEIGGDGGELEIRLEADIQFNMTIDEQDDWITYLQTKADTATLQFTIASNPNYKEREGKIIISEIGGIMADTIVIVQTPKSLLRWERDTLQFDEEGGEEEISFQSNIDHEILFFDDWCKEVLNRSVPTEKITINIKENPDYSERSTMIVLKGRGATLSDTLFITQAAQKQLKLSADTLWFDGKNSKPQKIFIRTNQKDWDYAIPEGESWIMAARDSDTLNISVSDNTQLAPREEPIIISTGLLSQTLCIIQRVPHYIDGEYLQLQQALYGEGIPIVISGDGFTEEDMSYKGIFETTAIESMEHFFSIEPYTTYRDYFSVYMLAAISPEKGVSYETPGKKVNNRFGTLYEGGSVGCNDYEGIKKEIKSIFKDFLSINEVTTILFLNSSKYAGRSYMWADGFSLAICPVSRDPNPIKDFKALIMHEAGGHGFAKLADEYIYYQNQTIPTKEVAEIKNYQEKYDFYSNLDFTYEPDSISWRTFYTKPEKYSMVGAYEGGATYGKGIWRPEQNSCMNDNISYYNAPSRWAIVKRIKELSGDSSYSITDFINDDIVPAVSSYSYSYSRALSSPFTPTSPPVIIIE